MTAEVAILNRQGIALAADSAVTINFGNGVKVYNSVNKLFTLSKYAPIGIMVFGTAELTGVPWETIIKSFRASLEDQRFERVEQYAEALFEYIRNHPKLFSEAQQRRQFFTSTMLQFRWVLRRFEADLQQALSSTPKVSDGEVRSILTSTIRMAHQAWDEAEQLKTSPSALPEQLLSRWSADVEQAVDQMFGNLPLSPVSRRRLREIASWVFSKDMFPNNVSGVVIAGFGEDEYFPCIASYDVEGVLFNALKLRRNDNKSHAVEQEDDVAIVPFAQQEMVDLFMQGIAPNVYTYLGRALNDFAEALTEIVIRAAGATAKAGDLRKAISKKLEDIFDEFKTELDEFITVENVGPVVLSVGNLPKEEIAAMAESLVNLTSFKRRVTRDPETVGGPIDVAVVSKGDGFIWIKRKHYFDPELNHQFFDNYYEI